MPTDLATTTRRTLQAFAGLVALGAAFELLRLLGILPRERVPGIAAIAAALVEATGSGALPSALGSTALAWFAGVLVAAAIGVPLGLAVGLSPWADSASGRLIEFLRPVPVVALVPMAIVLFGIELAMQIFLVALACVWPLLLGTRAGVRAVDPLLLDTARAFGLGAVSVLRRVVLVACVPAIATALRLSASLGLVVAVAAELISGSPGLGALLINSQRAGNVDLAWAILVVTGLFGVAINLTLAAVERYVAGWQELSTEAAR